MIRGVNDDEFVSEVFSACRRLPNAEARVRWMHSEGSPRPIVSEGGPSRVGGPDYAGQIGMFFAARMRPTEDSTVPSGRAPLLTASSRALRVAGQEPTSMITMSAPASMAATAADCSE